MKDLDGQELRTNDRVAVSKGGRYHDFYIGLVTGFTDKMVKVTCESGSGRNIKRVDRTISPKSCVIVYLNIKQ